MSDLSLNMTLCRDGIGSEMYAFVKQLFPFCRSITGEGVRETLRHISQHIPLEIYEVPTGTKAFDWAVPFEWNIKDAYIKDKAGRRIVDFKRCNLHVVGYSIPVHEWMPLEEIKKHIFTLPEQPDLVPYRTSYYSREWGFCISHKQLASLTDQEYEVCIDSSLKEGSLTYGECVLKGAQAEEILLSAHVCHPSLANDNLSGIALNTFLAKELANTNHKYTYRFIFAPGTIGSIVWLSSNEGILDKIKHGLVISCVGDKGGPTYKCSRQGNALIDKAVRHVLNHSGMDAVIKEFSPYGYDERQYCSPGFNLPVGLIERSQYGEFPEYHTSGDNLDLVKAEYLLESYGLVKRILNVLENNDTYMNTNPKCEPQLGKRGLYKAIGGDNDAAAKQMAMLWILNQSDGTMSLLDIADRANLSFEIISETALILRQAGLLRS